MRSSPGHRPVFRFAPSPNGPLHLGHALSALLNYDMAQETNGRFLLRIEDIDLARCTPEFEAAIYEDLSWLGLNWETPVCRQSEHFLEYGAALEVLKKMGVVYPAFMTRGEVKAHVAEAEQRGGSWPRDPNGSPLYPSLDRERSRAEQQRLLDTDLRHAWRLDVQRAATVLGQPLSWRETGEGTEHAVPADPAAWGDVILSRSDAPSSYHLSVTVDDARQGVTHVVRGLDLYHATAVQRLLQELLGLPEPTYHHHRLILDGEGRKLSKSERATGLCTLRAEGASPAEIRRRVGL
jgi:glutamyl-Q tRNA(Asp) synthetase